MGIHINSLKIHPKALLTRKAGILLFTGVFVSLDMVGDEVSKVIIALPVDQSEEVCERRNLKYYGGRVIRKHNV